MSTELYESIRRVLEALYNDARRRRDEDEAQRWFEKLLQHAKENGR